MGIDPPSPLTITSLAALPLGPARYSRIQWTELRDGLLQADYGTNLPVHSRIQRFWFDTNTGLLRRNDYTPVAAARDARAANVVFEHGGSNGIRYTSKRRVKMTFGQYGWALPVPDCITLAVEHWQLRCGGSGRQAG